MWKTASEESLSVNEAGLSVSTNTSATFALFAQAVDCYKCDLLKISEVNNGTSVFARFGTESKWNLALSQSNNILCEATDVVFKEHGIYNWTYDGNSCFPISVFVPPQDPFIPIYVIETTFLLCAVSWRIAKYACRHRAFFIRREHSRSLSATSEVEEDLGSPVDATALIKPTTPPSRASPKNRIRSVDVFRGITISLMIFVNYGGGKYWFMEHTPWNGITVADLIFPWFAWIMGMSIAMKVKSELRNSSSKAELIRKFAIRSLSLILLGLVLTNLRQDDLSTIRIPGVLQRLGVAYFIVATLEALFMKPQSALQNVRFKYIEDVLESWRQWMVVIVIVIVHTCITFWLPVPNCPSGYLGAGGLFDHSSHPNCTGGAAGYVDRLIFGENHIYARPTCQKLYKCSMSYDPEGLLGVMTTVLCVYLGVHAGRILQVYKSTNQRMKRWLTWSLVTFAVAELLCGFSINDGFIPINKNLWSLSYVLLCSGSAFLMLSILHFMVDKKKWWPGSPFYQAGMNSVALYIGHTICQRTFPWQWKPFFPETHAEYVGMDLWATVLWMIISVHLYKRKIFITV